MAPPHAVGGDSATVAGRVQQLSGTIARWQLRDLQAGRGWKPGIVGHSTIEMRGDSAAGHVIRTLTPLAVRHPQDGRFEVSPLLYEHRVVSVLMVPVFGPIRPWGVLGRHGAQPREFSADETAWLQILANVLRPGWMRKWLRQGEHDQQLLRAEQMMAIGQVAAGVAHELRNPLTSIKGLMQVNLRESRGRGLPTDDLEIIEQEIRPDGKDVADFLDFARPPQPDRRLQEIPPIVERVLALAGGPARKQHVALQFLPP